MRIRLYTGPGCELCDQAKELIFPFLANGVELQEVDVTQSLETKKAYGLRIPVVVSEDGGRELAWPFSSDDLASFLQVS